ncbi:hypothetical protein Goarm_018988 [Gossypium armourianum]|uniref:RNase H type-1 domain-containing protein n=1 Tax=Gossypium armourianum TaxID=34283 RepID=A0A7J9IKN4_9ROSI|nr:hypothetical protein [Gossypium armourianum]
MANLNVRRVAHSNKFPRCKVGGETLARLRRICLEPQCRLFVCGIWVLWLDRNKNLYERKSYSGIEAANYVKYFICELDGLTERKINTIGEKEKWKAPENPTIKINFDAYFDSMGYKSASAIVARNCNREIKISKSCLHTAVGTAFDVEAIACYEAILTGIDMGLTDVIVKGDSKSIINKCMTKSIDKSQISAHIRNIQKEKVRFQSIIFHFVPRSANQLAHIIATTSLKLKEMVYLIGKVSCYAKRQLKMEQLREPD